MLFIFSLLATLIALVVAFRAIQVQPARLIVTGVGIIFALLSIAQLFTVVPAGHVGVIDVFGSVSDRTLKPGINLVNPLADIVHFSIKTQEVKETSQVPSREGLTVGLEISLFYRLDPEMADDVYKTIGADYLNIILIPLFRSVTRGVTAEYEAKALYTSEREILARKISEVLAKQVKARGIIIEETPLRQVSLPVKLTDAIEEKLRAEQESQRMEFILDKERKEAERKKIEAQGISDFQEIVSRGIDQNLLKWKGIEATEVLAKSSNAKIVVIGSGADGLPVILGQ